MRLAAARRSARLTTARGPRFRKCERAAAPCTVSMDTIFRNLSIALGEKLFGLRLFQRFLLECSYSRLKKKSNICFFFFVNFLGNFVSSRHSRRLAHRDVLFFRTSCDDCFVFFHPTLLVGVRARAGVLFCGTR